MIELLIKIGDKPAERFRGEWTRIGMGRSVDNEIPLVSATVGRRHLRIEEVDGRLSVDDMGSTNGTIVNGERMRTAPLRVNQSFIAGLDVHVTIVAHEPVIDPEFETSEATFLDPVQRDPDDDDLRVVYSDFLEERGLHLRAEYLRNEIAFRRSASVPWLRAALVESRRRLEAAPRWRMLVARPQIEGCSRPKPECKTRWGLLPKDARELESKWRWVRSCETCGQDVAFSEPADLRYRSHSVIAVDRLIE